MNNTLVGAYEKLRVCVFACLLLLAGYLGGIQGLLEEFTWGDPSSLSMERRAASPPPGQSSPRSTHAPECRVTVHAPVRCYAGVRDSGGVQVGMVGDSQTGKSGLVARYVDRDFDPHYTETNGVPSRTVLNHDL